MMDLNERAWIWRSLLVLAAMGLCVTMLPAGVEAAAPTLMRLVDANSDGRAQVDGGKLRVGDGSGAMTVDGTVQARLPNVRHGSVMLDSDLATAYPQSFDLPRNFVLTDVIVKRSYSAVDTCQVWLFEERDGGMDPIHVFGPSAAEPVDQLHLESGIAPTAPRFGFFLNSPCSVDILWSGHAVR